MKELGGTGWLSNRGRQNVASFLTKDLRADWRIGAELFELLLVDHDVAANYAKCVDHPASSALALRHKLLHQPTMIMMLPIKLLALLLLLCV